MGHEILATREVPVSLEESWHEMYAAKRNQKYRKNDKKTVCFYHVTYAFQSESALCSCPNIKEVLVQNRRDI